ncbi:hypothetical protein [Ramlibacter sp. WS9]|uniref:hypothetical protein n=1 Tax=Ramlibacter sp. WS9 TaxID=1882741 RepID=UPI001141B8D6|nr:hypothetical protein [Ramlibacter sp. WS9]ROZ69014.1 hypothetical protein EEB15_24405 [Ramlibacter sp. WS9]
MTQQTDFSAYVQAQSEELAQFRASAVPPSGQHALQQVKWGRSDIEQRITQAAAKAIKDYNASPAGQALRAGLAGKSMDDIRPVAAQILNSLEFMPVRELVQQHARAQEQDRSFRIQSISLGIEFSLFVLVAGVEGSVGIAVPPHDWTNPEEYVVYLTTGAMVGAGANEFGGLTLGLWNVQPTDMAGPAWGIQANLGDTVGLMVEASFSGSNFIGLSFSEGEDGGISLEFVASDTWVWGWDEPHVFQPRQNNYMIVQSIVCNQPGENAGDEIYFKFTPDSGNTYRYPTQGRYSLKAGQSWDAGRSIYFDQSVLVELFDNDDGNDDPRGSVTYTATGFAYNTTVSGNGGQYQINAVLNPTFPSWPAGQQINSTDSTSAAPGACGYRNKLYYFWRASSSPGKLYFSASADGMTWPAGEPINGVDYSYDGSGPTAIAFGSDADVDSSELFVFWRGGNNGVYWSSSPTGQAPWPNGLRIGTGSANAAPAPCVFGNTLYLFWTDTDSNHIVYSTFDPASRSWSTAQSINTRDASGDRLAACEFQGKLYVFWRNNGSGSDKNQIFYSASSNGSAGSWPNGQTINAGETTDAGPGVNVYQGNLFVFFTTSDSYRALVWTASATGTSWPANTPAGPTGVQGPPSALDYNESQYLAWTNGSLLLYSPSKS